MNLKNATRFVFEENSVREITWSSWRHRFRFKMLHFENVSHPYENGMREFSSSFGLESVFEKIRFCWGLMWTVDITVERKPWTVFLLKQNMVAGQGEAGAFELTMPRNLRNRKKNWSFHFTILNYELEVSITHHVYQSRTNDPATTLENANTMRGYSLSTAEDILYSLANKITAFVKKRTLVDFFTVGLHWFELRWFELGCFKCRALLIRT